MRRNQRIFFCLATSWSDASHCFFALNQQLPYSLRHGWSNWHTGGRLILLLNLFEFTRPKDMRRKRPNTFFGTYTLDEVSICFYLSCGRLHYRKCLLSPRYGVIGIARALHPPSWGVNNNGVLITRLGELWMSFSKLFIIDVICVFRDIWWPNLGNGSRSSTNNVLEGIQVWSQNNFLSGYKYY